MHTLFLLCSGRLERGCLAILLTKPTGVLQYCHSDQRTLGPTLRISPSNYEEAFHWEVTCLPSGGQCCNQHSLQRDWSSPLQYLGLSLLARVLVSGEAIGERSRAQLWKLMDLDLTILGSNPEESEDTVRHEVEALLLGEGEALEVCLRGAGAACTTL